MDERQVQLLQGFFLAFGQIDSFDDWRCSCHIDPLPAAQSLADALAEQIERLREQDRESGKSKRFGFRIPVAYEPVADPFTDEEFDALLARYLAPQWLTEDERRATAGLPPFGHLSAEAISGFQDLSELLWVPTVRSLLARALGGEPVVARQVAIVYSPHERAGWNEQKSLVAIEGPHGRLSLSYRCSD